MKPGGLSPRFVLSKNQLAKSLLYADKGDKTMIYKVYYQETKYATLNGKKQNLFTLRQKAM